MLDVFKNVLAFLNTFFLLEKSLLEQRPKNLAWKLL